MLSRRILLKHIIFTSAGLALISSCNNESGNLNISAEGQKLGLVQGDEEMLATLCQLILPLGPDTKPGEEIEAHRFVLKMVSDCKSAENQKQYLKGLNLFKEKIKKETGQNIAKAEAKALNVILQQLETNENPTDDLSFFYNLTKSLTIQSYTGGRFFLTSIQTYKLVPGKYQGCVPI